MTNDDRVPLTYDQAVALLPSGERIHTFRSTGMALIGADWPRDKLLQAIRDYGAELAGESATNMRHGMAVIDHIGPLFIETIRQ